MDINENQRKLMDIDRKAMNINGNRRTSIKHMKRHILVGKSIKHLMKINENELTVIENYWKSMKINEKY